MMTTDAAALLAPYHGYDPRPAVVPAQRRRFVAQEAVSA